jgi:hypothetical protein
MTRYPLSRICHEDWRPRLARRMRNLPIVKSVASIAIAVRGRDDCYDCQNVGPERRVEPRVKASLLRACGVAGAPFVTSVHFGHCRAMGRLPFRGCSRAACSFCILLEPFPIRRAPCPLFAHAVLPFWTGVQLSQAREVPLFPFWVGCRFGHSERMVPLPIDSRGCGSNSRHAPLLKIFIGIMLIRLTQTVTRDREI